MNLEPIKNVRNLYIRKNLNSLLLEAFVDLKDKPVGKTIELAIETIADLEATNKKLQNIIILYKFYAVGALCIIYALVSWILALMK